jgi:peptidoglycan/LPS O-acetylase OafA/YrhL
MTELGATEAEAGTSVVKPDARVPGLDGLRGVAVLLVLMNNLYPGYPQPYWDRIAYIVSNTGWMGVDLFFVLSGCLITGILLDTKRDKDYFRNFYARRVLRIFPLYFGFLLVWVAIVSLSHWFDPRAARSFLDNQGWYWSYLANLKIAFRGWGDGLEPGGFWSLAVEEQFYLLWPLVVLASPPRRLVWICVGMIATALLLRVGWTLFVPGKQAHLAVYVATPSRMDGLAAGALVAIGLRYGLADRLRRWAPAVAAVTTFLLGALFVWRKGLPAGDPVVQTVGFTLIAACAAAYVTLAITLPAGSRAQRVFAHPVLRFFGWYSYGIYVLQMPIRPFLWNLPWIKSPPQIAGHEAPAAFAIMIGLSAIATAAAVVSWHLYEKHFLRLKALFPYGRRSPGHQDLPVPATRMG